MTSKRQMTQAWGHARKTWQLRTIIERGRKTQLSDRLFGYIHETLAIAWLAGFKAGERAEKRRMKS